MKTRIIEGPEIIWESNHTGDYRVVRTLMKNEENGDVWQDIDIERQDGQAAMGELHWAKLDDTDLIEIVHNLLIDLGKLSAD